MKATDLSSRKEWLLTSALFLIGVPLVAFASFFGAFFTPGLYLYDFAFAVIPSVCPAEATYYECYAASGWAETWSYLAWVIVAGAFGGFTIGRSVRSKAIAGIAVIVLVVLVMRAVVQLLGLRVFVDTI